MKAKLLIAAIFTGAALMAAAPAENLVLKQDFENGVDQFVKAPPTVKYFSKAKPELVDGRVQGTKAVHFGEKSAESTLRGMKMPVPGNISMWIKTDNKITQKHVYRRFIATTYSGTGYFGLQEYAGYALLFVHGFNKKNKNVFVKAMEAAKWNHVSINFADKHVDVYVNGVLTSSADLPESISKVIGNIVYGSKGVSMDSLEIYNRILTADEVKALAK